MGGDVRPSVALSAPTTHDAAYAGNPQTRARSWDSPVRNARDPLLISSAQIGSALESTPPPTGPPPMRGGVGGPWPVGATPEFPGPEELRFGRRQREKPAL